MFYNVGKKREFCKRGREKYMGVIIEMEGRKRPIRDWSPEDQPRERLATHKAASLSQVELLTIIIRTGNRHHSAYELARQVLDRFGDLHSLYKCTIWDLMKIPGIGKVKATSIVAALELGRRLRNEAPPERQYIHNSRESADYARPLLMFLEHEAFAVMYLTQAGWVQFFEIFSNGGKSCTSVDARIILKRALVEGAVSLIVFHNHPSGNWKPSKADEQLTQKLQQAARDADIKLLDHVIIGEGGHFSFADEGLL